MLTSFEIPISVPAEMGDLVALDIDAVKGVEEKLVYCIFDFCRCLLIEALHNLPGKSRKNHCLLLSMVLSSAYLYPVRSPWEW